MKQMPLKEYKTKILVVMGVSGSGKTTVGKALAEALHWSFIEGDQFHSKENVEKMANSVPLTDQDRAAWLDSLRNEIENYLDDGKGAVLACSALKADYRQKLKVDSRVQFVFLNIPFEVAKERMSKRKGHFMPASLLESQFETLQQPEGDDSINVDARETPEQIVKEVVAKLEAE